MDGNDIPTNPIPRLKERLLVLRHHGRSVMDLTFVMKRFLLKRE
jgi:hypothetical protein